MHFQQLFDSLPIVGVSLAFAIAALITSEAGFRHGRWWQERSPDEKEGPTTMIVGSLLALFIVSLNDTIDLHATRVTTGVNARVPVTVILLLLGSMLTLGMVGYNACLTRRRSPLTSVILIVVLAAVVTLVIDLDRPRDGFLKVNQQPLIDLQEQIGAPR